jgi:hypothetical protein
MLLIWLVFYLVICFFGKREGKREGGRGGRPLCLSSAFKHAGPDWECGKK